MEPSTQLLELILPENAASNVVSSFIEYLLNTDASANEFLELTNDEKLIALPVVSQAPTKALVDARTEASFDNCAEAFSTQINEKKSGNVFIAINSATKLNHAVAIRNRINDRDFMVDILLEFRTKDKGLRSHCRMMLIKLDVDVKI